MSERVNGPLDGVARGGLAAWLGIVLALAGLGPTVFGSRAAAQSPDSDASTPDAPEAELEGEPGDPASPAGPARRRRGAVEDESLEELLGLGLAETLGTTDAASRTEEDVLSAPASVTSLDARAIRLSGARTIPEILRLVPGVQVQRIAPGSYLVAMRGAAGITGNNVIVMLDGVPLNSPLDGSIDWSTVPIHVRDLDRIDVVRGPVSTIHGANAYTGVIQLISYHGYGTVGQGAVRAEVGVDTRGRPVTELSGRYVQEGARFQRAVFASGTYDAAFRDAQGGGPAIIPRMSGALLGRFGATLDAGQLDVEFSGAVARGSSLEHLVLESHPERRMLGLAEARFVSRDLAGALGRITAFSRLQGRRIDTDADVYDGFSYAGTRSLRSTSGADLTLVPHRTLTATFGGQVLVDHVTAPYIHPSENGTLRPGYGFFARVAWDPAARWSFTGAVRGDVPTMTGELAFSYRGSAVYHTENFALRVVGATAFRAPTYVEVGGRFIDPASNLILLEGEPTLRNPSNDGAEIAATFSPRAGLRFGITGWASRFRNLVIEDFQPIVRRTFVNDDHARWVVGGDAEVAYTHSDGFEITAFVSLLGYPTSDEDDIPTVATAPMNSRVTAGATARGSLANDRMRYGVTAAFASGRSYLLYAGIPPTILNGSVAPSLQLTAMIEHELGTSFPVWLSLRVQSNLPRQAESALPGASLAGTAFLVGVEHRRD